MKRYKTMTVLAIIVIIQPFLGFPLDMDTIISITIGLLLLFIILSFIREEYEAFSPHDRGGSATSKEINTEAEGENEKLTY
jgi:hypothetical protein